LNLNQLTQIGYQTWSSGITVPVEALVSLRRRLVATRWPDRGTVSDQSQGVPLVKVQDLVRYWEKDLEWRKVETKKLNALPQFVTESA